MGGVGGAYSAQLAHAMVYHAPPGPQAAEAERLRLSLAEQAAAASAPGFLASKQMSESVKRMKDGVEVTCQFDEHCRESDGVPDPGQSLHLPHVRRVGPLEELYTSYARFMEVRQDGRGGTYVMSRQELWEMVRCFVFGSPSFSPSPSTLAKTLASRV